MTDLEKQYRKNEGLSYKIDGSRDWPAIRILLICSIGGSALFAGIMYYLAWVMK